MKKFIKVLKLLFIFLGGTSIFFIAFSLITILRLDFFSGLK